MEEFKVEFDPPNPNWSPSRVHNLMFLQCQETYLNHLLQARGHVFVNEVYDAIGMPRTAEGQLAGWALGYGDAHISFGIDWEHFQDEEDAPNDSITITLDADKNILASFD